MTSFRMPPDRDPVMPSPGLPLTLTFDGVRVEGVAGQTIAGVLLGAGIQAWRAAGDSDGARGVFCGIGVCFGCVVTVNGLRDVRACQRRARDGDEVACQGRPPAGEVV